MDIRELRIGDIVTTNGKPMGTKEGEHYRIIAIDSKSNMDNYLIGSASIEYVNDKDKDFGSVGASLHYLNPIPLTDELLCSIGIIPYMRANTSTYYAIKDYCQLDYISNMGYYVFTAEAGKQHIRTRKNIIYLHQLQHEMFDAGIEFKIEL